MSTKYKIRDQDQLHFVSFSVVEWIDVFTRNKYKEILLDSLRYCQKNKGLEIYAWCIMTDHVHLIIGTNQEPMENILRDFKSFTSRTLKEVISGNYRESRRKWMVAMLKEAGKINNNNNEWQFWQQSNHPIELFSNDIMDQKLYYIHRNPVVAGFVDRPEDWVHSSARDYYCNKKGLLDIKLIE